MTYYPPPPHSYSGRHARQEQPVSDKQRKYYHGVVVKRLSEHLKLTAQQTHALIKKVFNCVSTARLTKRQFEDLMSKIRTWASTEKQLYIATPNEGNEQ